MGSDPVYRPAQTPGPAINFITGPAEQESMGFGAAVARFADRKSVYEGIGGRPTIERVHKIFYDKLYAHPWLGQFFKALTRRSSRTNRPTS